MTEIKLVRNIHGAIDCELNDEAIKLDSDSYVALLQDAIQMLQSELLSAESFA
jgi:hypothetical protein